MTLGELYERYRLFLFRYRGRGITAHKIHGDYLSIEVRHESRYQIPWDTEVVVLYNEFFINNIPVGFCARQIELTPESLIQADMSGGYIPVDISNKKRTK